MRRLYLSWIWNGDEADNGVLISSWGVATIYWWLESGLEDRMLIVGIASVFIGLSQVVLSSRNLARKAPWDRVRLGLPVCAMMVWLGVALDSMIRSPSEFGWATVLYLWLAYRAVKSFYRLITRYVREKEIALGDKT